MIQTLGTEPLKGGGSLVVKLLEPPEPDVAERLVHFLEHKGDASRRAIVARLNGKYTDCCVDRYFIGEIDGEIAGQLWYGWGRTRTGVANFGHVYTEPAQRGKGITNVLMRAFIRDFNESQASAALCVAGKPWVASIYLKNGFQAVRAGSNCGDLILLRRGGAPDFRAYESAYFAPGAEVRVVEGTMAHRHDVDKLLAASLKERGLYAPRLAMAHPVKSYEDALFRAEDGAGLAAALTAPDDRVLGWAFVLSTGSPLEARSKVLGFEIHPNYAGCGGGLVAGAVDMARRRGLGPIYAFAAANDEAASAALKRGGFGEAARLKGYCGPAEAPLDMLVFRCGGGD